VLDGLVGAVVGGFELAVWTVCWVGLVVETAVREWPAETFVKNRNSNATWTAIEVIGRLEGEERGHTHHHRTENFIANVEVVLREAAALVGTRLARDGDPEPIPIEENDTTFTIAWKGRYRIEGSAFVYVDPDTGKSTAIHGYPTHTLTQLR
jgi:hypothetical protein